MPRMWIDSTLEMAYEDDDFTDPWKTPQAVVYQHCNTGSSRMYYAWVPTIARHYRFIRVNRRGQGGSTVPPPGRHWTLKEWSDEMDTFLDRWASVRCTSSERPPAPTSASSTPTTTRTGSTASR